MVNRFAVVALASLALACAIALVSYKVVAASDSKPAPVATRNVVIANADLPMGARIKPEDVRLKALPRDVVPANSFEKADTVKDRVVTSAILKDEPLVESRLAPPGSGPGLAPMIPAGYRAVSVRVNDVIGVAGFIQPGMRVDVLASGRLPNSDDSVTRTVLQNVVVLSAGQVLQPEPKGQVINAQVVTLQVRPEEAEILALTSGEGRIQLVLRNSSDNRIEQPAGAHLLAVYGAASTPARSAAMRPPQRIASSGPRSAASPAATTPVAPPSPPRPRTVEVIRGTTKSDVPTGPVSQTRQPETQKMTRGTYASIPVA